MPETERTRATPAMPFMMLSIGKVTSCSTSWGASPSVSVIRVTMGRLRSGNTSIGMRGRIRVPQITKIAAEANTNRRWRRLAETRTLNTGRLLTDLIDELGAVHDDALAFAHAGRNEDAGGIEGLGPDGARLEQLSFHVPPDDALAVAATDDGVTAHNDPVRGLPALRDD